MIKKMKKYFGAGAKVLGALASLFMAFSFASCNNGDDDDSPTLKEIVAAESLTLNKDDTFPTTGIVYAYYDSAKVGTYSQPGSDAQDVTSKATFTTGSVTFKAGEAISVDSGTYKLTVSFGGKTLENAIELIVAGSATDSTVTGTYTINGTTYKLTYSEGGSYVTTASGEKVGTYTVEADGTINITVTVNGESVTYTAETDENGKIDTSTVTTSSGEAVESSVTYTVNFDVSGLADKISSITVKSTDDPLTKEYLEGLIANVTEGYTFEGWYTDIEYQNAVTYPLTVTASIRLYAKFVNTNGATVTTYTIAYSSSNGSTRDPQTVSDTTTMPSDFLSAFSSAKNLFDGWFYDEAYTARAYAGSDFSNYADSTNTVTLYAKWLNKNELYSSLASKADFVGLSFSDLTDTPIYARTSSASTYEKVESLDGLAEKGYDANQKYRGWLDNGAQLINNALVYSKSVAKFYLEFGTKKNPTDSTVQLVFNGKALDTLPDVGGSILESSMDAFIAVHTSGAGTVTATFTNAASSSNTSGSKATAGFINADGEVVKTQKLDNESGAKTQTYTMSYDVSKATTIYFTWGRNGDAGGGVKVKEIKFAEQGASTVNLYFLDLEEEEYGEATTYDIGGSSITQEALSEKLAESYKNEIDAAIESVKPEVAEELGATDVSITLTGFGLFKSDPSDLLAEYEEHEDNEDWDNSAWQVWETKYKALFISGDINANDTVYAYPEFSVDVNVSTLSVSGKLQEITQGDNFSVNGISACYEHYEITMSTAPLGEEHSSTDSQDVTQDVTYTTADGTVLVPGSAVSLAVGTYEITVSYKGLTAETKLSLTVSAAGGSGSGATAMWDFSTQPEGFPTSDAADNAVTDLAVPVTSGSGASLTATGRWKWNTDHLQAQASSGKTVEDAPTWTEVTGGKWLTFSLDKDSKVTIVYSGAGNADAKRFIAIYAADGTEILAEGNLGNDKVTKEFESVPAGTYTIPMNGSSIFSITCE